MLVRTPSARELARQIGVSHTAIQKAAAAGRIQREADGTWDVARVRRDLMATAEPGRSPLAPSPAVESPYARLRVAQLALKVEAQRLALDVEKGKLIDMATAGSRIDEIASTMRDAVLNWPARVAGQIAAEVGAEPHLVQTLLQEQMAALLQGLADRWDPGGAARTHDVIETAES